LLSGDAGTWYERRAWEPTMSDDPVIVHLPIEDEYIRVPDSENWGRHVLVRRTEAMREFQRARREIMDALIRNGGNWLDLFLFEREIADVPREECYHRAAAHIAKHGVKENDG
jgi:hypothetical protein